MYSTDIDDGSNEYGPKGLEEGDSSDEDLFVSGADGQLSLWLSVFMAE